MKKFWIAFGLVLACGSAFAQDPPKQDPPKQDPAAKPPDQDPPKPQEEEYEATLAEFKGVVDVKRPEDKDWVEAVKNMRLPKGSEVCTGANSTAVIVAGKGLVIELKPVTMASLVTLIKKAKEQKVDTVLKFGSADIKLEKTEVVADFRIATPAVTTSISGSHGILRAWATRGARLISLRIFEGRWGRYMKAGGTAETGGPGDAMNDHGDLSTDLNYDYLNQFRGFGGEGGGTHDFTYFSDQWFEFGSEKFNPKQEGAGSSILPEPPRPPVWP